MPLEPIVEPSPHCHFRDFIHNVGLLGRKISPKQGLYLNTVQPNADLTHSNNLSSSGVEIQDYNFLAKEDSSCLKQLGHCDCLY
jgi:hypothetical protein